MERERGSSDVRWKTVPDERLQQEMLLSPTVDRRVRRTSRDVDGAERSRRLDSVCAGRRSSSHMYVGARPS